MNIPKSLLSMAVCSALTSVAVPTLAATGAYYDFIYVQGSTVYTFAVPDPPYVDAYLLGTYNPYTEIQTEYGTHDGQTNSLGDVTLFNNKNFVYAAGILFPAGYDIDAAGPTTDPLYSGSGAAPKIIPGVYHLTNNYNDIPIPATLYIVQPTAVTFTLSGNVNAVLNFEDFPRLQRYGTDLADQGANNFFQTFPVTGTLNGRAYNFGDAYFYTRTGGFSTQMGGLDFGSFGFSTGSPQLFTGPLFAPEFTPGTYTVAPGETLVISASELPAPIPEPSSWALMIAGLGVLGSLLRRGGPGRKDTAAERQTARWTAHFDCSRRDPARASAP